jgi:amino acid transporter
MMFNANTEADGGMPNSRFWAQIHPTLHVPVNCIWLVTVLCIVYTLILFGICSHC